MALTEIRGSTIDTNSESGQTVASVKWHCTSLSEARSSVPATYEGLDLTTKRIVPYNNVSGQYVAECSYAGTDAEDDPNEDAGTFEIISEEREEPIENFPDRQWLIDEYGAYESDGLLKFPMRIPKKTGTGTGLQRSWVSSKGKGLDNPLFNARTYPVIYEVAVRVYFSKRIPASLLAEAGTIISRLPSGFGNQGSGRKWWVERPHRVKQGGAWQITWRARSLDGLPMLATLAVGLEEYQLAADNLG